MNKQRVTLNCDMGESYGHWKMGEDAQVMPWIDMANIACGFHAGDPHVMSQTVKLAVEHQVRIGAHPSYPDLIGFGRRSIPFSADQIVELVVYQTGALQAMSRHLGTDIQYIKPHGALYNDMMKDEAIFHAVAEAASTFSVPLMILATDDNQRFLDIADIYDVPLLFEAFADRRYQDDGSLVPRTKDNAVLHHSEEIFNQVMQIANLASVTTVSGQTLPIEADTICVHGDNPHAIALIERISQALKEH